MKFLSLIAAALLLVATPVFATNVAGSSSTTPAPSQDNAQTNNAQTPPANSAATAPENPAAAPLRVMVGKSILINTTERLRRVSVTDPSVAELWSSRPPRFWSMGLLPARSRC